MLLCLLLCFLVGIEASATIRQGDALNKLVFDAFRLKRTAVGSSSSFTTPRISDLRSRKYSQQGLKEKDRIEYLPGQPEGVDFDEYAGYVTVDQRAGRALFYYFVQAVGDPSSKPLLLWLNGGPGCSSLGYGAMQELGPFRVMSDGKTLFRNPFAWNRVANVLFLESPAGVGFSYSNTTSDYSKSGDRRTAEDNYVFLVNWMERFPEYKGRDFYIAGESYAGHFVPHLATTILQQKNNTIIRLKGIMIGNAVINDATDSRGMFDYLWTHALISDETIDAIHKYCSFSPTATNQEYRCGDAMSDAREVCTVLNIYNIYAPLCSGGITNTPKRLSIKNFDPCSVDYVSMYLNSAEVQQKLHANVTKLNYAWSGCSQVIQRWLDSPSTVLPLIKELMASNIRVWIYSGDIDGRVPVTSTRYSTNQLMLLTKERWHPWYIGNEVGGYRMTYHGNLTFATVRGAGHEVPSYQAQKALQLVKSFLEGNPP